MLALISTPAARWVLGAVVALVALVSVYHAGRWAQRADLRAAAAEARIENKERADDIRTAVDALDDGALADELFDRLLGDGD